MIDRKILRDGHIHSPYCPHGTNDIFDLYVQKALEIGLTEISFTEHMPFPSSVNGDKLLNLSIPKFNNTTSISLKELLDSCAPSEESILKYFKDLDILKEKYKKSIKINKGLEVDFLEGYEHDTKNLLNKYGPEIEDSLLSVHILKINETYYCVTMCPSEFLKISNLLGGTSKVYDKYFETLLMAVKSDLGDYKPKRIGHYSLARVFNSEFPIEYNNTTLLDELFSELKSNNYELDFNTSGLIKPYCKEIYPSGIFMDYAKKYNIPYVYGSDAHTASDVGRFFDKFKS